ncbi:2-succinyl-6-hydroxy-2,4-cyclohexadiene-1-carboxylate synthase [Bacillus sp. Marseille-P3661]|uniref:2-succinyl-6-hydroxy-2, 4-cyclohexadiene-1-carboxylate synthase n=1 Tax=Bacillus sp. Marseille-P3661 TaxID=1936234 RepID=UPI000C84E837|nr:2-succinyl-6-hydroxy-2,4-cyclohexadiene-1-carboxylate synthase [Bacillus sp. Marseille-P3661]
MFLNLNGVEYYVEVHGKGEPLLLLHGFTGSGKDWHPFIEQWKTDFQLIVVDIIGHGKTEQPADHARYSIEAVANDLVEMLNLLNINHTSILGYSMGGRLALTFTVLFQERVRALILESSSPGLKTNEEQEDRKTKDHSLADKIEKGGIEAFVDFWERIPLFASQATTLPPDNRESLRKARLQNQPLGLANSLRGMGTGEQPSWWSRLKELTIPVLLLAGEWDEKFCNINKSMNVQLNNSKFVIVNDAGHAIHMEQPSIFGKIIIDYLKDNL